jgi:hypothetical protein
VAPVAPPLIPVGVQLIVLVMALLPLVLLIAGSSVAWARSTAIEPRLMVRPAAVSAPARPGTVAPPVVGR